MEGRIKILFNNNVESNITIRVDGDQLMDSLTWKHLSQWWILQVEQYPTISIILDDGSALLLTRAQITSISLTPDAMLDVNTTHIN